MLGRIVEIEGEGRRLSLERGFLAVSGPDGTLGKVPLDDIEAVILSHPATSFTGQALSALAEHGAPVVICGGNFKPAAYLLPVDGHHAQADRIEAQAQAALPLKKRLWAQIVRAKILAQADALNRAEAAQQGLPALAARVRSGDPGNIEAQAAQRYFPAMFGKTFTRSHGDDPINAMLNYGYTVLRAATARAIVAAGLHPSLSIAHQSRGDALRLADDMMEPFRPTVDLTVRALIDLAHRDMDPPTKRALALVLHADFETAEGVTPLSNVLARLCVSLAQVFTGERKTLLLPKTTIPIDATPENDGAAAEI